MKKQRYLSTASMHQNYPVYAYEVHWREQHQARFAGQGALEEEVQ
jgi:hypothetical protein